MRVPHRSSTPPDRRASRLLSLVHRSEPDAVAAHACGLDALGAVVLEYGAERLAGRGMRRVSDHALREAVRRIAAEARTSDAVRAERMLIELKATWTHLPAVKRCGETGIRAALWDRLVHLYCEEFYAPADADHTRQADSVA